MDEEEYEQEQESVVAPPPVVGRVWSWTTERLLWTALGAAGLGFVVWFLMSYTGARARWIAEVTANDGTDD